MFRRLTPLIAMVFLAVAACGGSSSQSKRDSTKRTATTETPTTVVYRQSATVTPSTGLHEGQAIHIVARGFSPNQSLGIVECADRKTETGEGDCNISGIKVVSSDADGVVAADFTVTKGPLGGNRVTCSSKQACLLSITQLTLTPAEVATAPISFAD
jgi:neocarzinostatin family protein